MLQHPPTRFEAHDLGPLAWVLDDLRNSLSGASNAIRRFVWDIKTGDAGSATGIDTSDLRMARRQFYQSAGALEMVGQHALVKVLKALERLAEKFVQWPEACTEDAAQKIERASRAVLDYLESILKGSQASPVALFPQQRALMELVAAERIHPADLWPYVWQWAAVPLGSVSEPLNYSPSVRGQLSGALLPVLKALDRPHACKVVILCAGLAAGESVPHHRSFWAIAAGFFEAIAIGGVPDDVYVRRTASQVIPQFAQMASPSGTPSERVAQDLLFFCAVANPSSDQPAPWLSAVRSAYALDQHAAINYETSPFGRFDPAQLAQVRKRIDAAAETWSALAGGDLARLDTVIEQFAAVREAISKLHTENAALVAALSVAAEATARAKAPPKPAIAIEVATSILYLEAAYDDLEIASDTMTRRGNRLATRLQSVCAGGEPQPIEIWMEQLYRRVSDRQTMGTVTLELRAALEEVEKSIDRYCRNPADQLALQSIPVHLGRMRGVFSVLGLDQAALAVLRMRSSVEQLLASSTSAPTASPSGLPVLVNSLSAIGFLIDMLTYQPAIAKTLFVYDEVRGEFKFNLEREGVIALPASIEPSEPIDAHSPPAPVPQTPEVPLPSTVRAEAETVAKVAQSAQRSVTADHAPQVSQPPVQVPNVEPELPEDVELHYIFLDEAAEVVRNGLVAVSALVSAPGNVAAHATLRRAFHTLKGSARMVGNTEFGDAAWAFEQLLNASLAEQQPAQTSVVQLCEGALRVMQTWIQSKVAGQNPAWEVADLARSADRLRLEKRKSPLPTTVAEPLSAATLDEPLQAGGMDPTRANPGQANGFETEAESEALAEPAASLYVLSPARPGAANTPSEPDIRVGDLRLSPAFFEVFLNEARAWSQSLQSEIAEWDPQEHDALTTIASALAHSLQGSASAVGFTALSRIARALEQALDHVKRLAVCSMEEKVIFADAARHIAELLDAFSNQTLVEANPAIIQALKNIMDPAPVHLAIQSAAESPAEPVPTSAPEVPLTPLSAAELDHPQQDIAAQPVVAAVATALEYEESREELPTSQEAPLSLHPLVAPQWLQDHDLESEDLLDPELLPIFLEEGRELVPALRTTVQLWAAQPDQVELRGQALRLLHTLKGSARLAGALRLGEQAHRIESSIESVGLGLLHPAQVEPCLQQLDQLNAIFEALEAWEIPAPVALLQVQPLEQPEVAAHPDLRTAPPATQPSSAPIAPMARTLASQSVRVRSQILDRLIDQSGEVMISRSRVEGRVTQLHSALGEFARNLDRLRQQLRDLELQAELQMHSRLTQTQEAAQLFDPLEFDRFTRVQEVSRMMAETVSDIGTVQRNLQSVVSGAQDDLYFQGRRAKELQHDLLRMRLIEFEGISDRLYGVVRQASKDSGKPVRLDIVGGAIEIDRGMLDRMTQAFEHLLRNAVAHGIESPDVRLAKGKPATGAISIEVHQDGSDVSVTIADDGAGLQIEKIRARAIATKRLAPDQPLSQEEAARMLFIPGFSTAEQVTELAGRGIGMDVVLTDVSAVGGRVECVTQPGHGASFKVVFPLTTAVTQVVMLRVGTVTIGVPANLLETVLRVSAPALKAAYDSGSLEAAHGSLIPFFWAGALLNVSDRSHEVTPRQHAVAVIRSAGQRVALHVDEVLGSREVVVKNLGPQLSGLPGLVGMSVLASGSVVMIYNPVALASLFGDAARSAQALPGGAATANPDGSSLDGAVPAATEQAPLVLVVDDSLTVRRVTQRLLKREGFRVALAMDGLQALEVLQGERPVVLVSDIEMPRMDGLDLVRNIRRNPALADLPIIAITSRIAQKHRDHAAALGVNHYLGKPYSESELVALIRSYCPAAAAA